MPSPLQDEIISNWSTLIENFNTSPKQFYQEIGKAITERQIPDVRMTTVNWTEGGVLSAKRGYLRIARKDYYFDICGAPFGTGFFVSWWLSVLPQGCLVSLIADIPVVNMIAYLLIKPWTYYRVDTAMMFQTATHSAVLEVIDSITTANGIRGLSETERKPIMREFLR